MGEKFNLKWNDFQSNVSKSFGLLRNESYLQDVTLVSDDLKHYQAHKLVLSACSDYFKSIFKETKHQYQTLLCLDGISSWDLQNILDYVYDGEVKIAQDHLDRFLNIAQKLKLEGLMQNNEESEPPFVEDVQGSIETTAPTIEIEDAKPMEIKERLASRISKPQDTIVAIVNGEDISQEDHKQRLKDNLIANDDGSYSCKICSKTFQPPPSRPSVAKVNARRHVEVHIEGLNYNCSQCEKTFRSKNALTSHSPCYHNIQK